MKLLGRLDKVAKLNRFGKKRYRLSDLKIFEISMVDVPANGRKFLLYKRMTDPQFQGMTDQKIEAKLQKEWAEATPEEREKVFAEINRLNGLLDLMLLEKHLDQLDSNTRKEVLADEGRNFDYNPETGEFTRIKKVGLTPLPGSETKSHFFDFSDGKWHKKNK
jgi:hypothetical protein